MRGAMYVTCALSYRCWVYGTAACPVQGEKAREGHRRRVLPREDAPTSWRTSRVAPRKVRCPQGFSSGESDGGLSVSALCAAVSRDLLLRFNRRLRLERDDALWH